MSLRVAVQMANLFTIVIPVWGRAGTADSNLGYYRLLKIKTKDTGSRLEGIPGRRGDETLDPAHVHTGTTIKISESIIS